MKTTPRSCSRLQVRSLSLEERLRTAEEHLLLLADLFELQVVVPDGLSEGVLSRSAYSALATWCRRAGGDLRSLRESLPADLINWTTDGSPARKPRRGKPTT